MPYRKNECRKLGKPLEGRMSIDGDKFEIIVLELLAKRRKQIKKNKAKLGSETGLNPRKIRFWESEISERKDILKVRELYDLAESLQYNLAELMGKALSELKERKNAPALTVVKDKKTS